MLSGILVMLVILGSLGGEVMLVILVILGGEVMLVIVGGVGVAILGVVGVAILGVIKAQELHQQEYLAGASLTCRPVPHEAMAGAGRGWGCRRGRADMMDLYKCVAKLHSRLGKS